MKRRYSYEIALSAIAAAIAILAVVAQAYVDVLTIAFNVIAALAIAIPLTKDMWKGALMAFAVTSIVSFFIVNLYALPFIMMFGSYAIVAWALDFKLYKAEKLPKALKITLITVIKIGYYALMFWGCYKLMEELFFGGTINFFGTQYDVSFYVIWGICFAVFCVYDPFMRWVFKNECILVSRIVKK